tara:strand:+ start:5048 stop:6301 length:1254 start_codon:yes stop_codon:yes gene_type:complete
MNLLSFALFTCLFLPSLCFGGDDLSGDRVFIYLLTFLNFGLGLSCLFLIKKHQAEKLTITYDDNINKETHLEPYGTEKLKELFICDFEKAKLLIIDAFNNEKLLGEYIISKLPLAEVIELKKSFNNSELEAFLSCLRVSPITLKQQVDQKKEDRILELVYRISLEEEHNNRFAVIRAERWAALIKKDNELGKYLFLFSEMSFVAKVFSFLDKEDINLVMDLVLQDKGDVEAVQDKVNGFIQKAKKEKSIDDDFQKMLSYFNKFNDAYIGLGVEKISIFHKNEVKIFDVLIKNISPTLLGLISFDIFKDIRHEISNEEFYKYLIRLPQDKRSYLFNKFLRPTSKDVDEYKRFLSSHNKEPVGEGKDFVFKKYFYEAVVGNPKLYSELFNHWKLPLKRLSSGLSFENSFKEYYPLKKSA